MSKKIQKRNVGKGCLVVALGLSWAVGAQAAATSYVAFQGVLKASTSSFVADQTACAQLTVRDSTTAATLLAATKTTISISNGVFTAVLPSVTAANFQTTAATDNLVVDLNVSYGAACPAYTPTDTFTGIPVYSVPSAMVADTANNLASTASVGGAQITGVATMSPTVISDPAATSGNILISNGTNFASGAFPSSVSQSGATNSITQSAGNSSATLGTGTGTVTLGGGTATGAITIGQATGAEPVTIGGSSGTGAINIGVSSAGQNVTLGSTAGGTVTIGSGTTLGAINLKSTGGVLLNNAVNGLVTIGGGTSGVSIGASTGTVNIAASTAAATPVNIGTGTTTGLVTIGNATGGVRLGSGGSTLLKGIQTCNGAGITTAANVAQDASSAASSTITCSNATATSFVSCSPAAALGAGFSYYAIPGAGTVTIQFNNSAAAAKPTSTTYYCVVIN